MKKIAINLLFLLAIPFLAFTKSSENKDAKKKDQTPGLAAGCTPASTIIFLEFNNVRTRVEAGGLWWQDRANGNPDYEVPKGSNSFAIFAGGLWLGGTDVNGQLKAAASLFGQGVDYWTGPLDIVGNAEIDAEICSEFDKFFEISRVEVAQFRAYHAAKEKGTAEEDFPGYETPKSITDWPGNPDFTDERFNLLSDRLAPYISVDDNVDYNPENGDFPFYDLVGDVDCRAPRGENPQASMRPLFGDKTFWWIFNDKGNTHRETRAPSIGMEIHAQAFAFATSDAVNDMTFYNFELINRSTFTLTDTYFASYVDPDLGNPNDDYVGCDVVRGLGYCYNGDGVDESVGGRNGYGTTPAAIGIDFFEGPFQDPDGIDNAVGILPNEALNGLGYGDGIADNERYGMRRFVFYNRGNAFNGDPNLASDFYNYMRGIWKDGSVMRHGGNGFRSQAVEQIRTAFMFPGDSDPLHWGTTDENGVTTIPANTNWTEDNPGEGEDRNDPFDRRFLQSAGPFTLRPGNINDITVGVVFAQAESGGRLASVDKLFNADDKAQALFDNCFQVLNGPDAPEVTIQELDEQLIFYLSNSDISNNREEFGEPYEEDDVDIVTPDTLLDQGIEYDNKYRFQGYQVFQLAGPGISVSEIGDPDKARLVFQADIKDSVVDLTNFEFDDELQSVVPEKMVTAANDGIRRSFSVTEDLFATGTSQLINFKTYYYVAIAYGYNEFKPYAQDVPPDFDNPFAPASDGQTIPYIRSRRGPSGGDIAVVTAIPHDPLYEAGGTVVNAAYGDGVEITRLQGSGNGGNILQLSDEWIDRMFEEKPWENGESPTEVDYAPGGGPLQVQIADPLNVVDGTFFMQLLDSAVDANGNPIVTNDATWKVWREGDPDTVFSNRSIAIEAEQLLFSPNWGLSISIKNSDLPGARTVERGVSVTLEGNGLISSTITYDNPSEAWLGGIPDQDQEISANWILSGTFTQATDPIYNDFKQPGFQRDTLFLDADENYENILAGTVGPYGLIRAAKEATGNVPINTVGFSSASRLFSRIEKLNSIVLVITNDKSRWSRCPVIETGNAVARSGLEKLKLSVDKDGNPVDITGFENRPLDEIADLLASDNEENAGFISAVGMGWFPGYVFNKETGERLNIAFGEDSKFSLNNGDDMLWNPNSVLVEGVDPTLINQIWGGKHFIYIFRKFSELDKSESPSHPENLQMGVYDHGALLHELLSTSNTIFNNFAYNACSYAGIPTLVPGQELMSNDVRIDINITRPFETLDSDIADVLDNNGRPVYRFRTSGVAVQKQQTRELADALKDVNVVPNPYKAVSAYEQSQLDNIVKFVNLPEQAKIRIYNTNGTLIRTFNKSSPLQFLDWDLKNQAGIPIASGVYIIHVEVPGVGEKILKWFGVLRPVDLNNF